MAFQQSALKKTLDYFLNNKFDDELGKNVVNLLGGGPAYQEFVLIKFINNLIASAERQTIVVVLPQEKNIPEWRGRLAINIKHGINVVSLPHTKYWGSARFANQIREENERLQTIAQVAAEQGSTVVLATLPGLLQNTMGAASYREQCFSCQVEEEMEPEDLVQRFRDLGYQESDLVSEPGYYSLRGGIIDVFPGSMSNPIRFEFIADTIAQIRTFDALEQRSLATVSEVLIGPAQEGEYSQEKAKFRAQKLFDYLLEAENIDGSEKQGFVDSLLKGYKIPSLGLFLPLFREQQGPLLSSIKDSSIVFWGKVESFKEQMTEFLERTEQDYQQDIVARKVTVAPDLHYQRDFDISQYYLMEFGNPFAPGISLASLKQMSKIGSLKNLVAAYRKRDGLCIVLLVHSPSHATRMEKVLLDYDVPSERTEEDVFADDFHRDGEKVIIAFGSLADEVFIENRSLVLVPEHLLFGESRKQATKTSRKQLKVAMDSFRNLAPGALVVHVEHGIGKFLGMRSMEVGDMHSEFIEIEYAGNDKVYIPIDKLGLVQKYSSGDGEAKLDRLKSQGWQKRKMGAKKAVRELAINLLEIHAKRKLSFRSPYSSPNELYFEFESDFPYDETEDQDRCINDVQEDLSHKHPMDRLICGDVGFGKTEIALRAAMRVACDGLQVMLLAPTTVLSYQHFQTFKNRFEKFGIVVGLLNRFVSRKNINQTVESFTNGKVDILIGTHRILSKDVVPKNLGLVIIDEEQRFGVGHKETLKGLRAKVDVLSLSATPIPRSLHMAMLGLKEISVLMTPPRARLPIKTYIAPWNEELIARSIRLEVSRGGQVFFIHNRVENILEMASALREIVPEIELRIAHGQMAEKELETVILDFIDQKFSVLLCTTIIESGIDMPNVNTILIHQADRFGLAQLYQMRGRVGRSSRQSYAYFLTSSNIGRNVDAQQRLEVLAAHQELGAGFQVASYDLELRGAGDLLGADQSGRVHDVGIDLYMEMLEKEILKLQGKAEEEDGPDPEMKISRDAYLPKGYIPKEAQRLAFYKRLFSAKTWEDLEETAMEMEDRFGKMPEEARSIVDIAFVKHLLKAVGATHLTDQGHHSFELRFKGLDKSTIRHLQNLPDAYPGVFTLNPDYSMMIATQNDLAAKDKDPLTVLIAHLKKLKGGSLDA